MSNFDDSELTKNLSKMSDYLSKLLQEEGEQDYGGDVHNKTVLTLIADQNQHQPAQLQFIQQFHISPPFQQLQPTFAQNANFIQQNIIRLNQGNHLTMMNRNVVTTSDAIENNHSMNIFYIPPPPPPPPLSPLPSNIPVNYMKNDIETIIPKLSEINFNGFQLSSSIKPNQQHTVMDTVNPGPSNFDVNVNTGTKPKSPCSKMNLLQTYYLPLIRKFHRIYMALNTIRNERKNLKNLLQSNENNENNITMINNNKMNYEIPQTNHIKTLVKLTEKYITQEFIEMKEFFEKNYNKFHENTMQTINLLLHDFKLNIIKLSDFRGFTLSLTDNLKDLLDVLFKFLRYCCLSHLILQHQIKTKSRESREIHRNIGV